MLLGDEESKEQAGQCWAVNSVTRQSCKRDGNPSQGNIYIFIALYKYGNKTSLKDIKWNLIWET